MARTVTTEAMAAGPPTGSTSDPAAAGSTAPEPAAPGPAGPAVEPPPIATAPIATVPDATPGGGSAGGAAAEAGAPDEARPWRRPALSPSRAADFKQCPLLYRFRAIDRLPERPSRPQVRGTLVHAVLERLFALPAEQRLPATAQGLVEPAWAELRAAWPDVVQQLFTGEDDPELTGWLDSAAPLLESYFRLEDPRRLHPEATELLVETELESGLPLRGYLDRLDVAPTGEVRVVDYKTAASPGEAGELRALFQMKFYALAVLRQRGVVPTQLRLLYLADTTALTYTPDEAELLRFARLLEALWEAVLRAGRDGDFRPSPGPMCRWCDHKPSCPAWGGTAPAYPGWPQPPETQSLELQPPGSGQPDRAAGEVTAPAAPGA